jgi:hypothetical protein
MLRRSLRSLLLVASLPTALPLLAGCPDAGPEANPPPSPVHGPVSFAQLAPAQRDAAIAAALGLTPRRAASVLRFAQADHERDAACPARSAQGDAVSYLAPGCKGASGLHYAGNATAINSPVAGDLHFIDDVRNTQPSQLVFDNFVVTSDAGDTEIFDGRVEQSQALPSGAYRLGTDLHLGGGALEIELDYSCDADGCSGSGAGAVADAGDFTLIADLRSADGEALAAGSLELRGADVLTVDLSERFSRTDCYAYRIDGALAGKFCPETTPAPPPSRPLTRRLTPALVDQVMSARFLCTAPKPHQPTPLFDLVVEDYLDNDRHDVAAIDETSLTATLKLGDRTTETALDPVGPLFSGGPEMAITFFYEKLLTPGTDTPFACSDAESIGVRFDGKLTDGQAFCIIRGNAEQFPDATGCARGAL